MMHYVYRKYVGEDGQPKEEILTKGLSIEEADNLLSSLDSGYITETGGPKYGIGLEATESRKQ